MEGVGIYEQMLKAGLRFLLNAFHRELLKCLGLSINQISSNAWRIFIAMKILYGTMSDGARSLTVREFFHCYRPDEIDKSRGVYSFVLRSSLLKVIYETSDSNRDWKSRYFFLEGAAEWVVQGIPIICPSIQLGAFYTRPIRTHPSLFCCWSI